MSSIFLFIRFVCKLLQRIVCVCFERHTSIPKNSHRIPPANLLKLQSKLPAAVCIHLLKGAYIRFKISKPAPLAGVLQKPHLRNRMETRRSVAEIQGDFHFPLVAHILLLKLLVHTTPSMCFQGQLPSLWVFSFLPSFTPSSQTWGVGPGDQTCPSWLFTGLQKRTN